MNIIDERIIEDAAMICALMASSSEPDYPGMEAVYMPWATDVVGVPCTGPGAYAADLARAAFRAACQRDGRERWAEAEAILRMGWLPDNLSMDWTCKDSRANSSNVFLELVDAVDDIIRSSGHAIVNGMTRSVARLIMAQLAHVHGLVPKEKQ